MCFISAPKSQVEKVEPTPPAIYPVSGQETVAEPVRDNEDKYLSIKRKGRNSLKLRKVKIRDKTYLNLHPDYFKPEGGTGLNISGKASPGGG